MAAERLAVGSGRHGHGHGLAGGVATTTSVANRWWISLQVSWVAPGGAGCWTCWMTAATTRNAYASMARVTQQPPCRWDLAGLQPAAQRRTAAVDLVGGHPSGRHAGVQRALQPPAGQLRLGLELDLGGDASGPAARRVGQPSLGQVQLAVDHAMPGGGGIGQVDGDLGVVDLAGGAGVLALHPDGVAALLEVAGLVDDQQRSGVGQVLEQVVADVARTACSSQTARLSRCCRLSGVAWPACSAIVQQFLRAAPTAARAPMRGRAVGAPPARTGRRSGQAARPALSANWQGLPCGLRPLCDLRLSTYHRIITGGRPGLPAGSSPRATRDQQGHDLRLEY